MLPWISPRAIMWTKAHQVYSLEFEERGLAIKAFHRTWDRVIFRRVAIGVQDWFEGDATRELSVVQSVVVDLGSPLSAVAISRGSHILTEAFVEYLDSGFKERLVQYPIFELRLLNKCL